MAHGAVKSIFMTEDEWPRSLTRAQGRAIRHYRELAGLKHEELARKLTELGLPMQRTTLVNIEQGLRKSISAPELLAMGYVLGVPPAMIMIPLGLESNVEAIKDHTIDTWRALEWVSGGMGFNHEQRPVTTAERTLGQEIRSNYLALQDLAEGLIHSNTVLQNSDKPEVIKEARERASHQESTIQMLLDIMQKKGLTLPQLPTAIIEMYPQLARFYDE